jgi:hypothetical protein
MLDVALAFHYESQGPSFVTVLMGTIAAGIPAPRATPGEGPGTRFLQSTEPRFGVRYGLFVSCARYKTQAKLKKSPRNGETCQLKKSTRYGPKIQIQKAL